MWIKLSQEEARKQGYTRGVHGYYGPGLDELERQNKTGHYNNTPSSWGNPQIETAIWWLVEQKPVFSWMTLDKVIEAGYTQAAVFSAYDTPAQMDRYARWCNEKGVKQYNWTNKDAWKDCSRDSKCIVSINDLPPVFTPPSRFLVWSPTGTSHPRVVHNSESVAFAECKRLAELSPGQKFFVLAVGRGYSVETKEVEKVVKETVKTPKDLTSASL